jgi:uroporphyrinogen decarboxylase
LQNSRERVKAAISHQLPDRIPRGELCIEDDLVGQCLNCSEVGFEERAAFIEELGLDLVTLAPDYPVSSTVPETLEATLPDLEKWALKTPLFTFALLDGAFGWGARTLGYTDFLVLSRSSPLSFQALIDRVENLNRELIKRLIDQGVDGIIIADDIAYQRGLIINPDTLREFFFPSLARQVKAASGKSPVFFHSDGKYSEIIPELINCGFRGLQCFERQTGMDPLKLKAQHPELCVWGTLEVEDLQKAADADYLEKLASGINTLSSHKGFILGTTCGLFKGIDLQGLTAIYRKCGSQGPEVGGLNGPTND